jgi:hypothetical protein
LAEFAHHAKEGDTQLAKDGLTIQDQSSSRSTLQQIAAQRQPKVRPDQAAEQADSAIRSWDLHIGGGEFQGGPESAIANSEATADCPVRAALGHLPDVSASHLQA